jgi:ribonuclease-3
MSTEIHLFYEWLSCTLRVPVSDSPLFLQALQHRSFTHEKGLVGQDNERLEYLGDAVLDLILSDLLFQRFSDADEGKLSQARSYLVNESALAEKARVLGLPRFLRLGIGEEHTGGRNRDSNLSSAFEALVGAVYLVLGYLVTYRWISRIFESDLSNSDIFLEARKKDSKSLLQELTQSRFQKTPEYRLIHESGPAHSKRFEVAVYLEEIELGRATSVTRKQAEQLAALNAIRSQKADVLDSSGA